jgi:FkbM family methyltransferase
VASESTSTKYVPTGAPFGALAGMLPRRTRAWLRRKNAREPVLAGPSDIRWCYRLLLGREQDRRGFSAYAALITDHAVPRADLVSFFISSPEFRDRLEDEFGGGGRRAPAETHIGGLKIYLDPEDRAIGAFLGTNANYESDVTELIRRRLLPGDCFVDVGASFGYFTALASSVVGPSGRVIAIEPGPQNQTLLLLNARLNGLPSAEIHQTAVSDGVGLVKYGRSGSNGTITEFDGDASHIGSYELVRSTTLDCILKGDRVDMMKIDVEGAEGRVLRGARDTLRDQKPILVFEFSPPSLRIRSGISGEELLRMLDQEFGYSFDLVRPDSLTTRPRSPQDIVQAFEDSEGDHVEVVAWVRER